MALSVFIYFAIVSVIVQASPIVKNDVHEKLDELLERVETLLNTTKNRIDNELQLNIYITEIVNTAVLIKKSANSKIIENVDEMVSIIITAVAEAKEKGMDVSGCVGDSITIIKSSGEDLKKYVTTYTSDASDDGIMEMDDYMTKCDKQVNVINRCLLNIQKCKLEEGTEQTECYDDLTIQLSNIESEVPKKIDDIQTSSGQSYIALIQDMNDHVNTNLTSFDAANMKIVQAVLDCIRNMMTTTTTETTTITTTTEKPTTTVTTETTTTTPTTTTEITTRTTTETPTTTTEEPLTTPETTSTTPTSTTEITTITTTETPTTTTEKPSTTTVTPETTPTTQTTTTESPATTNTPEITTAITPRTTTMDPSVVKDQVCIYEFLTNQALRIVCY